MRVNTGNVVLVNIINFKDEPQAAMYVVLECDCDLKGLESSDRFTAVKISSNAGLYQVPLSADRLPFLEHDSYINCDSVCRFTNDQAYRIIGTITPYYMNRLLSQTSNYFLSIQEAMVNSIPDNLRMEDIKILKGGGTYEEVQRKENR